MAGRACPRLASVGKEVAYEEEAGQVQSNQEMSVIDTQCHTLATGDNSDAEDGQKGQLWSLNPTPSGLDRLGRTRDE